MPGPRPPLGQQLAGRPRAEKRFVTQDGHFSRLRSFAWPGSAPPEMRLVIYEVVVWASGPGSIYSASSAVSGRAGQACRGDSAVPSGQSLEQVSWARCNLCCRPPSLLSGRFLSFSLLRSGLGGGGRSCAGPSCPGVSRACPFRGGEDVALSSVLQGKKRTLRSEACRPGHALTSRSRGFAVVAPHAPPARLPVPRCLQCSRRSQVS